MKLNNLSFYFLFFISIILSCKKGSVENNQEKIKSTKELLQANVWVMKSYTMYPGLIISGDTITDIYSQVADCDKDGFSKFTNYDTIIYNNGILKCLPNEPQETYTRYLLHNDTSMTEYFTGFSYTYTITTINENYLEYTFESNDQNKKQLNIIKYEKRK
jgi:hypothetical protein